MLVLLLFALLAAASSKPIDSRSSLLTRLGKAVKYQYASRTSSPVLAKMEPGDRRLDQLNKNVKKALFDGDMLISEAFIRRLVRATEKQRWWRPKRQAYKDEYYPSTIWEEGVPFVFDEKLPAIRKASLIRAMKFWQEETCVTFRPRENETNYLYYTGAEEGCFSSVGRDESEPQQIVNIGQGCSHFGITSHEVAHALGLFHHQQRYDRDSYIEFIPENVPFDYLSNFAKIPARYLSTYDTPYDIGSVMHYTPTEFAKDRFKPSLLALDENLQGTMGSMDKPSFLDVLLINRHYRCSGKLGPAPECIYSPENCTSETMPVCLNGGYVNPLNCTQCKCPPGFEGDNCGRIESSEPMNCGGLLPASYKLRRMKITLTAGPIRRQCVYQVRAPKGRRLMIGIERISGKCQEGCYTTAMEAKMAGDFRPVGYRFCCQAHSFRRLVSRGSAAPLIFYAQGGKLEVTLFFRWIIDNPEAEDTLSLTEEEMNEVYQQKDEDQGLDMQILEDPKPKDLFVPPNDYNDVDNIANDFSSFIGGTWGDDGESLTDFSVYELDPVSED